MMRKTLILVSLLSAAALGGCVSTSPVVPYYGAIGFNQTTAPVDITFDRTQIGDRVGKAACSNILGLVSWGDASVMTAARNGGIDRIDQVDCRMLNVIGIYSSYETIVTGGGSR
ncbi:MAG: TRL-like family protein [bacterium]|nr:TRL-like family protein [bacterium]